MGVVKAKPYFNVDQLMAEINGPEETEEAAEAEPAAAEEAAEAEPAEVVEAADAEPVVVSWFSYWFLLIFLLQIRHKAKKR